MDETIEELYESNPKEADIELMDDETLKTNTIKAYKNYIDEHSKLTEKDRSKLLMKARKLDIHCSKRGIYVESV